MVTYSAIDGFFQEIWDITNKVAVSFMCKSRWPYDFAFLPATQEDSSYFTSLSVLSIFSHLNSSHPSRFVTIFYFVFSLPSLHNLKQFFICIFVISFFWWSVFKSFVPFFFIGLSLLLLRWKSSLYFFGQKSFSQVYVLLIFYSSLWLDS